jgi:hypothetical protein
MSAPLLQTIFAALAPWIALSLLLIGRNPRPTLRRILVSMLLSLTLLVIPAGGISLCRWIALLEPNPSITLTVLLAIALLTRITGLELLRSQDWQTAWIFGSVAALILYPMGLGLTSMDSYTWGWGLMLPIATTTVVTILLLSGNRFGIILLLSLLGMLLSPMESRNRWDFLIDPFYAIFSLIATIVLLVRRFIFAAPANPSETGGA